MKFVLPAALRKATALTNNGRPLEATSVIQDFLTAPPPPSSTPTDPSTDRPGSEEPRLLGARGQAAGTSNRLETIGPRLRGSLGDVVRALGQAKVQGLKPRTHVLRGEPRKTVQVPEGALFLEGSFTAIAGTRTYKLYVPASVGQRPGLVVMLHGCTQDADDFAIGTGMNQLAEEFGFLVAYPNQSSGANPSSCWNWFAPKDQHRGTGEPSIIAGLTRKTVDQYAVDRGKVFVAGLSAGGAMAAVMGSTYPDLYAAIGVHSGLPYGAATDVASAFAAMKGQVGLPTSNTVRTQQGEPNAVPVIVIHGAADQTVHPSNADRIIHAHQRQAGNVISSYSGVAGGRRFTRTTVSTTDGITLAESWMINGAGHAWSGGNAEGSFTDAVGPDASREMVRFFLSTAAAGLRWS